MNRLTDKQKRQLRKCGFEIYSPYLRDCPRCGNLEYKEPECEACGFTKPGSGNSKEE